MDGGTAARPRAADDRRRCVWSQSKNVNVIVHGWSFWGHAEVPGSEIGRSAGAEAREQLPSRRLVERVQLYGAIALIAQDFDERWSTFFLRWLHLPAVETEQVHLQGLDQEVLGIPTIRTRQRQIITPSANECIPQVARQA
jgi:hypothetical protein